MDNYQFREIVDATLTNLSKVAEVNTIIGKPLVTFDGTTILPISKITFAFVAGGGELPNKNKKSSGNEQKENFAGGSSGGASMTPLGFLISDKNGVRILSTENESDIQKLASLAKDLFGKKKQWKNIYY